MPRLFFALWPDETTRDALAAAAAGVAVRDGRLVRPENLHLTLRFLGEVTPARMSDLVDGLAAPAVAPFTLRVDHAGWWRRAGVAWLAPVAPPDALGELVRGLDAALAQAGFTVDEERFSPHVTVARKVRRAPRIAGPGPVLWPVTAIALVESVTASAGARYTVRRTWPLCA